MPKKKKKSGGAASGFGDASAFGGFGDFPATSHWPDAFGSSFPAQADAAPPAADWGFGDTMLPDLAPPAPFPDVGEDTSLPFGDVGAMDSPTARAALDNAMRADAMTAELAGIRASLKSLSQVNERLYKELRRRQQEVATTRQQVAHDERMLGEHEEQLSDIRQQIFEETNRILNAEDKLKIEEGEAAIVQAQLQEVKALDFATVKGLEQIQRIEMQERAKPGEDRPYDVEFHKVRLKAPPSVARIDELSASRRTAHAALSRSGPIVLDTVQKSGPVVRKVPLQVWQKTRRVTGDPGALCAKRPPATAEEAMYTNDNFKRLLTQRRGRLYEDAAVAVDMSISTARRQGRCCILFELILHNLLKSPLQGIHLVTDEGAEVTAAQDDGSTGADLRPKQPRRFRGNMEITQTDRFAAPPQVELTYAIHDGNKSYVRLRLPLTVARLLTPTSMDAPQFMQLWASPELAQSEVAFACTTSALPGTGADVVLSTMRRLQLGGSLSWLQGISEGPEVIPLAGEYPFSDEGSSEVLVVAEVASQSEFRSRSPDEMVPCRVAVRSRSQPLNRAIARTLLTVLSDE
mmetsp:Transcript_825/g.1819  ORF Transcript_825/g.1819 Transcript_825/m.1819 type:complete len:576 (+) Transcript_825:57-1784(+)